MVKNSLVKTDLLVVDNIRDSFYLYGWSYYLVDNPKNMNDPNVLKLNFDCLPLMDIYSSRSANKQITLIKPKFSYILNNQINNLNLCRLSGNDILLFIQEKISNKEIPLRYKPKIKSINNPNRSKSYYSSKGLKIDKKIYLYQIEFAEPIISLIEQKFVKQFEIYEPLIPLSQRILKFFKLINEHNGLSFEEYINNWSKVLLKKW